MSKKSKARSKQERLNKKRAIKQANRNRYATLRQAGENSKSIRFIRNSKQSRLANKVSHAEGRCGNIGCNTCNTKHVTRKIRSMKLNDYMFMDRYVRKIEKAIANKTLERHSQSFKRRDFFKLERVINDLK